MLDTPCSQEGLCPLHLPAAGRVIFCTVGPSHTSGGSCSLRQGGDEPMLTAAIMTLWKHTALWSLTAVKATGITSPICKSKPKPDTLQKLAKPTHPYGQRQTPAGCFVTQQPLSSSCFPSSSSSVSVLIWATPSRYRASRITTSPGWQLCTISWICRLTISLLVRKSMRRL